MIIGYTPGKGDRAAAFGGLHLSEWIDGRLVYRGKVGSGFDEPAIREIFKLLKTLEDTKKPIADKVMDEKASKWVQPVLVAEISFASLTPDEQFREPVFVRLRPDLSM